MLARLDGGMFTPSYRLVFVAGRQLTNVGNGLPAKDLIGPLIIDVSVLMLCVFCYMYPDRRIMLGLENSAVL